MSIQFCLGSEAIATSVGNLDPSINSWIRLKSMVQSLLWSGLMMLTIFLKGFSIYLISQCIKNYLKCQLMPNKFSGIAEQVQSFINYMQELEGIFWERNVDITALKSKDNELKKQEFMEKERNRVQRENWILKIIKSFKSFTADQKKSIYEAAYRMMDYYSEKHQPKDVNIDFDRNFTQEIINLFVEFYRQHFEEEMFAIKKIIRPNNAFAIVDLIKLLVETHRQFFKVKIQQSYKQLPLPEEKGRRKQFKSLPTRRQLPATEPSQIEESKKQPQIPPSLIDQRIKLAIHEKSSNFVTNLNCNEQYLKQKVNDTYFQLLERNQNNAFLIKKFQQKCFGKPKTFSYNVSGLYTQQQLKKMQKKTHHSVKQKFSTIKQLRGNPTSDQLKEYFKIQIEIQQSFDNIQSKRNNTKQVNKWFPLIVQKSTNQYFPLAILVNYYDKDLIFLDDFAERTGVSVKNYLKLINRNNQPPFSLNKDNDIKSFRRYQFLDINQARTRELLTDLCRVYSKDKRESIFPILRSNEIKQDAEIATRNKSSSDCKLPLFKNDVLSKKLEINMSINESQSLQLPRNSSSGKIFRDNSQEFQQNSPYDAKQKMTKMEKSRIDNIIQSILNQRNLTVSN